MNFMMSSKDQSDEISAFAGLGVGGIVSVVGGPWTAVIRCPVWIGKIAGSGAQRHRYDDTAKRDRSSRSIQRSWRALPQHDFEPFEVVACFGERRVENDGVDVCRARLAHRPVEDEERLPNQLLKFDRFLRAGGDGNGDCETE